MELTTFWDLSKVGFKWDNKKKWKWDMSHFLTQSAFDWCFCEKLRKKILQKLLYLPVKVYTNGISRYD